MDDKKPLTPAEVLALPMGEEGGVTIGSSLVQLLATLWTQKESFSGKRPFGDSGWEYDYYDALGRAGAIDIVFDEDGYIDTCDEAAGENFMTAAIAALGTVVTNYCSTQPN